jgi:S1-C subfamily serine protease
MKQLSILVLICLLVLSGLSRRCTSYTQVGEETVTTATSDWSQITADSLDAVVMVKVFEMFPVPRIIAYGTGFLISPDGLVVTAAHILTHVRKAGKPEVWIALGDGRIYQAQASHLHIKYDVGAVKIDASDLPYLILESEHLPRRGDPIISIGHAKQFSWTVTEGIVSNPSATLVPGVQRMQVTATMNFGSSGGPLINKYGHVVGLNQGIMPNMFNINLAEPTTHILQALSDLGLIAGPEEEIEPTPEEEPEEDSS